MKTIETNLATTAVYSDDGRKKYLIRKTWDVEKPSLAIILLTPSTCSGIALDSTTQLTLNNCDRLGFGSVSIVNIFATLDDFNLESAEDEEKENMKTILAEAKRCDVVVYASGIGKAKLPAFQKRSEQVLSQLKPYEKKLMCLTNEEGTVTSLNLYLQKSQQHSCPCVLITHHKAPGVSQTTPDAQDSV